jgi:S1-C subfamily serine protease
VNASLRLLEHVQRAVVGIQVQVPPTHPSVLMGLGSDRRGTGTLVGADGLIVTVNYMIMGARDVIVTFHDGRQVTGQVVARDFTTSLGLVKIDGRDLPYLEVVSSQTAALGQEILVVSSLGADKRCADTGLVSYLGPFDAVWEFVLERCVGVLSYTIREHVVIAGVMPGSPSEKAGLRQGDLVLSADGHEIHERKALYEAINRHRPGESVQLRIMRNNRIHDVMIPAIKVDDYLA